MERTASRESSVDRVKRDVVHSIHQRLILCVWSLISAVTLEREVIPATNVRDPSFLIDEKVSRAILVLNVSA